MIEQILFFISAALTVGGALLVTFSRNLMHSCLFLLATLAGVAGLYATLGADFLAATQLVVYAGGVVILMLFAVMLTGGTQSAASQLQKIAAMGTKKTYAVAVLVALTIGGTVYKCLATLFTPINRENCPLLLAPWIKLEHCLLLIMCWHLRFLLSSFWGR